VLFSLCLATSLASAQAPRADERSATLRGLAVDSVRGRYLSGAVVSVKGTEITATADSTGAFRISVPAGTYSLELKHPLLDSLGITLSTAPRDFPERDSTFLTIGIPSPRTLVNAKCPAEEIARGPAVLTGMVVDAVTGSPVADAVVSVSWVDYEAVKRSVTRTPQKRFAHVLPNGAFKMCGLPDGVVEGVTASRGNDSTAAIDVDLSSLIDIVSFRIPPPRSSDSRGVSITGRVVDATGAPAPGARVAVEGDTAVTTTSATGSFTLQNVRTGTRPVTIRKIGYEAVEIPVDVPRGGMTGAILHLGRSVAILRAMVVTSSLDSGLRRVGYEARRRIVAGSFVGPSEIARINPEHLQHVLDRVMRYARGGCTRFWVDGRLVPEGESPDGFISGVEIGAVEVYTESFVPPEFPAFTRLGRPCRGVIVWTKWKIGLQ
jgi:hypothetical protein